jgi:hypothetical protein
LNCFVSYGSFRTDGVRNFCPRRQTERRRFRESRSKMIGSALVPAGLVQLAICTMMEPLWVVA